MKLIMESWRGFLWEAETVYSGILKAVPNPTERAALLKLQGGIPEGVPIPANALHVTLIHQSILKPYRDKVKALADKGSFPELPPLVWSPSIESREDGNKRSHVVYLEDQAAFKRWVLDLMELITGDRFDPEPNRRFHISLSNKTGKSGDSPK